MRKLTLDVVATRGGVVESRHHVHAAVVDAAGRLVATAGDPATVTFWRSCAKPFQVMPLVDTGGFDRAGWGDDQLALACASHGGEPEHVAIAAGMLASLGLEEGDLACGPHEPLATRGTRVLRESGMRPTRLHNNCSGKHAAMLARAVVEGWPREGYERLEHRVQRACTETVAEWAGIAPGDIACAVDGCGVVVYAMPLEAMARAYARLGAAAQSGDDVPARIVHAMRTRPFLVGGTERFDTVLMEETEGELLAKVGAEGVHSVSVPARGLGFAVKVEDGAQRAQYPAVLRLLQAMDVLPATLPPRLAEFLNRPLRNTRGEVVGEVVGELVPAA
jgi:L-asparaginase II